MREPVYSLYTDCGQLLRVQWWLAPFPKRTSDLVKFIVSFPPQMELPKWENNSVKASMGKSDGKLPTPSLFHSDQRLFFFSPAFSSGPVEAF